MSSPQFFMIKNTIYYLWQRYEEVGV